MSINELTLVDLETEFPPEFINRAQELALEEGLTGFGFYSLNDRPELGAVKNAEGLRPSLQIICAEGRLYSEAEDPNAPFLGVRLPF